MLPMTSESWQLISTCVHEAAHSVIASKLGIGTASIRIREKCTTARINFNTEAQVLYARLSATAEPGSNLSEFAHNAGVIAAAGYIAEAIQRDIDFKLIRETSGSPGYSDLQSMKNLCAKLNVDESSTIEKWDFEAMKLVKENWELIEELAEALMESPAQALNGDEIHQIIDLGTL
jgi:hypothetical protein